MSIYMFLCKAFTFICGLSSFPWQYLLKIIVVIQFSSVAQSRLTLCDPRDCSTPGFSVHHQLPELAQTHVLRASDAIQPSHPLLSPSPPAFSLSQHQGLLQWEFFTSGGQSIGASVSAPVLPLHIQDWFPLRSTGLISLQSKRLSRVFFKPQFKSMSSLAVSFFYGLTLTSIHDYWKNHSFD